MARRRIIRVDYEFVDGKHFFTAASELGRGLCVAHGDPRTAFEEVGRQLTAILSRNHGLERTGEVDDLSGFEAFRIWLSAGAGGSRRVGSFELDPGAWALGPADS